MARNTGKGMRKHQGQRAKAEEVRKAVGELVASGQYSRTEATKMSRDRLFATAASLKLKQKPRATSTLQAAST